MCRGGVHICRLKRTVVRFPLLFSVDLNFALYGYKYRILIPVHLLNHPSRRPVLTRGAASYPPGLAALSCALTSLRGLRLARSPLAIASRRPRLAPNPGYCLPARSAAPLSPPLPLSPLLLPAVCPALSPPPAALSPPPALSSCRMGWRPRSRGACGQMLSPVRSGAPPTGARQRGGGSAPRRPGERRVPPPHSAELRSLRDQPLAPAQATRRHIASCPHPLAPAAWGWS